MDDLLLRTSSRRLNKAPATEAENYGVDSGSSVPAFLSKLWTLVEDPSTDELIYWDVGGRSFHVYDQGRFAKEILPLYFKHSNIASFIRQLNMYGFRKVTNVDQGSLKVDKDDMEFAHPYFLKDHEYLLELIKRKVGGGSSRDDMKIRHEDVSKVLSEVKTMRGKQDSMNNKLEGMKRENEALWREVASLRQKHNRQQQIVNKLIQFLMHLVGSRNILGKRKLPLMLNDSSQLEPKNKISRVSGDEPLPGLPLDADVSGNKPLIHDVTDLNNVTDILQESDPLVQSPKSFEVKDVSEPGQSSATYDSCPDEAAFKETERLIDSLSEPLRTEGATDPSLGIQLSSLSGNMNGGGDSHRPTLTRENSIRLQNDMSDHVDTLQTDLDSLKDLLSGNIDPSMLLGLFNPEAPSPNMSQLPSNIFLDGDDPTKDGTILGNELIEYNPPDDIPGFLDFTTPSSYLTENVDDLFHPLNSPLSQEEEKDVEKAASSKDYISSMEEVD